MCLPHLFLKLLRAEWKESHLDKSFSEVSNQFQKQTLTPEKYVKVKLCERVLCAITFTCKWFLTFQRFILKFSKKLQSPKVPSFRVPDPGSWVLGPRSRVLVPHFKLCLVKYVVNNKALHVNNNILILIKLVSTYVIHFSLCPERSLNEEQRKPLTLRPCS